MPKKTWLHVTSLRLDWLMVASSLLLVTYGLIILYTLDTNSGLGLDTFYKQLSFFVVGIFLFAAMAQIHYVQWSSYYWYLYIVGALLLLAVMLFGVEIRGVRGWFVLGPASIQPVEFIKIIAILFFAKFFSQYYPLMNQWRYILLSITCIAPYIGLLIIQPDLGSAFIVMIIWATMFVFTKVTGRQLLVLATAALVVVSIGWQFMAPYQQARLTTFLDPDRDPLGQGYNIRQALNAVGSGQLIGRGLGLGPQSQLHFLPENRTDFIFSVIAEELGFLGCVILICLYCLLLYRMYRIAKKIREPFGFYCVVGVIAFLTIQTYMNIAMNISLFPVTGIPLPLVSQGGSSLWSVLIALGLVQSIYARYRRDA